MLAKEEVRAYSFWEELGMTNVIRARKIVEPFSAVIGDPREGKEGIHGNHKTMTKFVSEEDDGYRKVSDVIFRFVRDAAAKGEDILR
ncbi:MAG: hypothetical protein LQ351_003438 [Letrouitia transgressa]|nr:MAG: hypothetical protein LQ351_003438 [Letrouitia transgressa]